MDANTARAWIAGYAAIVSTISLVWNIINSINQSKSKVEVSAYFRAEFDAILGIGAISKTIWTLTVDIVNHSKYKKYIEQPLLIFPEIVNGTNEFKVTDIRNIVKYPQELEPGQKFQTEIGMCESLLNLINQIKNKNKKVKVLVKDTHGKKYYSKKLKLIDLKEKCESSLVETNQGKFKRKNI